MNNGGTGFIFCMSIHCLSLFCFDLCLSDFQIYLCSAHRVGIKIPTIIFPSVQNTYGPNWNPYGPNWNPHTVGMMIVGILKPSALIVTQCLHSSPTSTPLTQLNEKCETQRFTDQKLSSSIFACRSSRPASVTSSLISTIWCFRPYKPYNMHVWWYLVVSGPCLMVSGGVWSMSGGVWSISGGVNGYL